MNKIVERFNQTLINKIYSILLNFNFNKSF